MNYKIGGKIKEKRLKANLSQSELAKDICTQSQISKIEKDFIIPSADILYLISKKLNISMEYFFDEQGTTSSLSIKGKKIYEEHLLRREYKELHEIVKPQLNLNLNDLERKYYTWIVSVCEFYNNFDEESIITLEKLLSDYKHIQSPEIDANICNSLSNMYFKLNNIKSAKECNLKALELIKNFKLKASLQNKIYYTLSKQSYISKEFDASFDYSNTGLNYSIQENDTSLLEYIIYMRCISVKEIKNIDTYDIELYNMGKLLSKLKFDTSLSELYNTELIEFEEKINEK